MLPAVNYYHKALQPASLLKVTLLHGCFSGFLNCTNGTKLRKPSHLVSLKQALKVE